MPGVLPGGSDWLPHQIAQMSNLLRGLLTQQQTTISNLDGQPVINFGLIPGSSPARYGFQFVNPATGAEVMFIGVDGAGEPAINVSDANGNVVTKLGQIAASPALYGLAVAQVVGASTQQTMCQVAPAIGAPGTNVANSANTAWTNIANAHITCVVGPSGIAVVTCQADISTSGVNVEGLIGFTVDGGGPNVVAQLSSAGGAINASVGGTFGVASLAPGSHTFQMQYEVANPGTVSFNAPLLIVQPL